MLVCKLKEKAHGLSGNAGAEGNGGFWTFNGDRRHNTHEINVDISGKNKIHSLLWPLKFLESNTYQDMF